MPSLHSFPYDPFQQRAIDAIEDGNSIFVAAPTGSGKTVLADYVIERSLESGRRVIYTSPIKALSNQKFRDFTHRYNDKVGIMTGDVTINADAPLIIMTTEIYRNTLLEDTGRLAKYSWVIFDEVHYLDDPERGTVWEESLLFTPDSINLLCLSATIPNVDQMAEWLREVHKRPIEVILEDKRPVPLAIRFQCRNKILDKVQELEKVGYSGKDDPRRSRYGWRSRSQTMTASNRVTSLVEHMSQANELPCIFFTFGRRRTEDLAVEISGLPLISEAESRKARALFDDLCAKFQLEQDRTAEMLGKLIDRGVAYHHAGMLPTVKEVVERCFTSRLVKVIVTTETFALGINMPARSVVIDSMKKRSGGGFELLQRRNFMQMVGRAGRRGLDTEGTAYLRINPEHVNFPEINHLLTGQPEPVRSRFNLGYATLLNLYRRHGDKLFDLYPKTFYYFQTGGAKRQEGLALMQRKLDLLKGMHYIERDKLSARGEFGSWLYGYELLLTELFSEDRLAHLNPTQLAILMIALVYEPKPNMKPPTKHRLSQELAGLCREPLARIHKAEHQFKIHPITKEPAFHLSHAMEAWMQKVPFAKLVKYSEVDEGEIVRYFRMTVQLLRQLNETPAGTAELAAASINALRRINRDVVDAEAQLRMG